MKNLKLLEPTFYEYLETSGQFKIDETEESGRLCLQLQVNHPAIKFSIKPNNGFCYLRIKNTPDHIVLSEQGGHWQAFLFECKRTVKEKEWRKVKKQFKGGISHVKMLAGLLELPPIEDFTFFTVFINDQLSLNSVNPVYYRPITGVKIDGIQSADWHQDSIVLGEVDEGVYPHRKIKLNQYGEGVDVLPMKTRG